MKKLTGMAMVGALTMLLPLAAPMAQEQEQAPMPMEEQMPSQMGMCPGHQMMQGMHGGMMGMGRGKGRMHGWKGGMHHGFGGPGLMEMHAEQLGLSDEQLADIREIWSDHKKAAIRTEADVEIAEMELQEILGHQPVDFDKAKSKIERIGALRQNVQLGMLEAMRKSHDVLTEEQREKLMTLRKHGCRGTMEQGGMMMHGKKMRAMEMKD
jgi:Spy/CpxP family protein refolding chaperone